jgi:hypothetical protein
MPEVHSGVMKVPGWNYVHDGLRRNLGTVIRYYRRHTMAVASDHFLVRILQSIDVPQSQNVERYYDNVDAMSMNLSMALKMTSSIYRGQMFKGVFYGPNCPEILVAKTTLLDPYDAHRNWEHLAPVQVLRHPITDLALNLADGHRNSTDEGIAVMTIDIPMLALQYRAFRLNEIALTQGGDSQRSAMQFVHMYVLPNMLVSHLDYVLFNRLNALKKDAPLGEALKNHPFHLIDYAPKLNGCQLDQIAILERNTKNFRGIMQQVPMVSEPSMDEVMHVPPMAPTQQVVWALSIARLPALDFLFSVTKDGANTRNKQEVQEVLRDVRSYRRNSMMKTLSPDLQYDIENEIRAIESYVVDINGR